MTPPRHKTPTPPAKKPAGKRLRQNGISLAELAIALAIAGLLSAAALIPMRILEQQRQIDNEIRRLETVRDAVVGYALRHRTKPRTIKIVPLAFPRAAREFQLPGGRPYLPCPDWNGDGFEDRIPQGANGFIQGAEVKINRAVTATVGFTPDGLPPGSARLAWTTSSGAAWHPYGECREARGGVPWRTLGIPPADGWGNRHTYFADPVFSNAIFGFDRQTIADIYDPRVPEAPGAPPAQRYEFFSMQIRVEGACPAVICNGDEQQPACGRSSYYAISGLRRCGWRQNLLSNLTFKAGGVTKTNLPGRKTIPAGGVTDGLPFVIVSHGPNGRFAVNHWATLNNPASPLGILRPVCNHAWGASSPFVPNPVAPVGEPDLLHEAVNANRHAPSSDGCSRVLGQRQMGESGFFFNLGFFAWAPPNPGDKSQFDDMLIWMTREELSAAIPGSIPPTPKMIIPNSGGL